MLTMATDSTTKVKRVLYTYVVRIISKYRWIKDLNQFNFGVRFSIGISEIRFGIICDEVCVYICIECQFRPFHIKYE